MIDCANINNTSNTSEDIKCACKGIRVCKLCEGHKTASTPHFPRQTLNVRNIRRHFVFCVKCSQCFQVNPSTGKPVHSSNSSSPSCISVAGLKLFLNAIDEAQESFLCDSIERTPWVESQSGRQKQDFGPKVNFKKQKVKTEAFQGFPEYMSLIEECFRRTRCLDDFRSVELCNLKYIPDRGSCIDPHFDDFWLWGERLVTLNLKGETVLTFSRVEDLPLLANHERAVETTDDRVEPCSLSCSMITRAALNEHDCERDAKSLLSGDSVGAAQPLDVIHVALPRRSLIVVQKEARHKWHHAILREHVCEERVAMTCRELSATFTDPGNEDNYAIGQRLLELAKINPLL